MIDAGAESELVTVGKYESGFEVHLARTRLESEGIDAAVVDEHLADYNMLYGRTMGGIRLLVRESDLARAREILEVETPTQSEEPATACPECGSGRIRHGLASGNLLVQVLMFLLIVATGLIACIFLRWRWRCGECGHVWRAHSSEEDERPGV